MNELSGDEQRLQRLMERTLRNLPSRPAPRALQERVLRELERRAARPWWRQDFAHWPPLARAAFVVICVALIGLAVMGGDWTTTSHSLQSLYQPGAPLISSARRALAVAAAARELTTLVVTAIPPAWLYMALAAGAMLYAVLFGLGAAAYRALYLTPVNGK